MDIKLVPLLSKSVRSGGGLKLVKLGTLLEEASLVFSVSRIWSRVDCSSLASNSEIFSCCSLEH